LVQRLAHGVKPFEEPTDGFHGIPLECLAPKQV
jgi:hypothetical protein